MPITESVPAYNLLYICAGKLFGYFVVLYILHTRIIFFSLQETQGGFAAVETGWWGRKK